MSGFSIRPADVKDARGIASVHVTSWLETYRGLIPDGVLDSLSVEQRTKRWEQMLEDRNNTFNMAFVALVDGQIVGFSSFGKEREGDPVYSGELYAIYLLKEFHKLGIGRSLVRESAMRLLEMNIKSMLVWMLKENSSRKFYEALGGTYLRDKPIEFGSTTLLESAYGWWDLGCFQPG